MKAEYSMKLNGVWYKVGDELPDLTSTSKAESKVETQDEAKEEVKYSKHKIMAMNVKQLRSLAAEVGIADADEYTGTELKEMLVEKLV